MKFYIQQNISEKDLKQLVAVFKKHNIDYELFYHIPFDNSYPMIDKNQKAFFYAASSVTDKVINDNENFAGVFAHTEQIKLSDFFEIAPELMWNKPIFMGHFKDYMIEEEEIFIRPLIDSKWIAGTVLNKKEYSDWKLQLENIYFDFNELIFVAKVHEPKDEYRLFFVNSTFSTGSQYKKNYELFKHTEVPVEVVGLALQFIEKNKQYLPQSFVVDIGVDDNHIGVIEVNGINNAGFYDIDKEKLIIDLLNNEF